VRVLSNQTPDDIINSDMSFLETIGLKEYLSPLRANGMVLMIKQMKLYAIVFKAKTIKN